MLILSVEFVNQKGFFWSEILFLEGDVSLWALEEEEGRGGGGSTRKEEQG